jgi:hypothetical protein
MTWKYSKNVMYDLLIFYRKLVDAVKDEIYAERRQKIKDINLNLSNSNFILGNTNFSD